MDLISTLKKKIAILDDGEYIPGLKAVLLHIETAHRHLSRGQDHEDETAFTDAIYRTNQAFEGSLKEAYRVITDKDPHKSTPFEIETYLIKNKTFRNRVLTHLKNYRTEWRNPSTHDYKLDFDVSEAFLAIVSVSAFACLLLDQIAEKLAFKKSQSEAEAQKGNTSLFVMKAKDDNLLLRTTALLKAFSESPFIPPYTASSRQNEFQLLGTLHGFFSTAAPDLKVETDVPLEGKARYSADLIVSNGKDRLIIEVKSSANLRSYDVGTMKIERLMEAGKLENGILLLLPVSHTEMETLAIPRTSTNGTIVVIKPTKILHV